MTDEPKFPARRGPASDGYRMQLAAPRREAAAKPPAAERHATPPRDDDPARRPPPTPHKLTRSAAH